MKNPMTQIVFIHHGITCETNSYDTGGSIVSRHSDVIA